MKKLIFLCALISLIACNEKQEVRNSLSSDNSGGCSGDTVASSQTGPLFKVDGELITRDKLPGDVKNMVYRNEFEAYTKNQTIFKEFALRIYLAKKAGKLQDKLNPPKLMDLLNIPNPSEKEMKDLFEQSRSRLPKEVTFEAMKPQIEGYLKSQKVGEVFQAEVQKMEADNVYQSMIAAPMAPEMNLDTAGFPSMGKEDAKVTLIEIADYTCGHCQHAHPIVKKLVEKYKNQIRFVQMNYSLRPQGESGLYVKGGFCAQKQGNDQFWKYHDKAFDETSKPHDHNAPGHSHEGSPEKVIEVAKAAGLDVEAFKNCISSSEASEFVSKTNANLSAQGISGTPAFILNNKRIEGGPGQIEAELKKLL